jgi:hypothetical protein
MKPPKSQAFVWWQRGVLDGKACAHARRWRYFEVYRATAAEALNPGEMIGVFECVYRSAFRAGYDAEKEARERRNTFSPRPRKRDNLKE